MYQSEGKACVNQLNNKRIDFGHVLIRPFAFIDFLWCCLNGMTLNQMTLQQMSILEKQSSSLWYISMTRVTVFYRIYRNVC